MMYIVLAMSTKSEIDTEDEEETGSMPTGYKIYFFIKEILCYLVLGVVLLPLRLALSGGYPAFLASLSWFGKWLGGNSSLAEAPPVGHLIAPFMKWLVVFIISLGAWMGVYYGIRYGITQHLHSPLVESL